MDDTLLKNFKILEEKELFVDGSNRICYLLACSQCGKLNYKPRYAVLKSIRERKSNFFCDQKCYKQFTIALQNVNCFQCNILFQKQRNQVIKSPNHFCSRSCAATYNNQHKTTGTRRSKLEKFLEEQIKLYFPDLECHFNDIKTIKSELDIYIPSLKFAIQINGIFHYEPIYGNDKLKRIQELDAQKIILCAEKNIHLVEVNCAQDNFSKTKDKRWLEVKNLIDSKLLN